MVPARGANRRPQAEAGTGAGAGLGVEGVPARRASRAVLAALALRLTAAATGVVVAGALTRQLGPGGFGELSLVFSVAIIASGLGELGTTQVVVGEMAARPDRRSELAAGYAALRGLAGVVLGAAGGVVVVVLLDRPTAEWAGLAVLATLPMAGVSSLVVLAQARLRPDVGAALALGQSVLWLVSVLVAGALGASLAVYGLAFLACGIAQAATTWTLVVRREPPAWGRWRPALRRLVRRGWPLAVAGVLGTVYYRLDGVLVFHLAGPAQAGFYAAGYRLLDLFQFAPAAVVSVLLPVLARAWALDDGPGVARALRLALTVTVAIGVPVAVGALVVGDRVASAVFGPDFAPAGDVLSVLGLACFSIATGYVYSAVLVASNRVGVVAVVSAVAAVVSVTADLVVIPRWGPVGAAWVTVAVEYLVSSALAVCLHRRHRLAFPWDRLRAAALAAAAMAAVAWALRGAPLPLILLASASAYVVGAAVLGVLTRDDLRAIADRRFSLAGPGPERA